MLCMVMQGVMLFPHHHHPESSGVCMNLLHCTEAHADCRDHEGRSCGSHSHDAAGDGCGFSDLVFSQPQREDLSPEAWDAACLPDAGPAVTVSAVGSMSKTGASDMAAGTVYERPDMTPLHILYITQASLLRAPTLFA
ncbi:hypothetical protein [Gallalistipes aquisgranensis]|uniref:hypothetical protein n=1 Tax=Gallalistipes aquisgranensis TaxID=2779358 RepID=UPI001CF8B143|nr:hypothetical protein [Gallalistipes aquisgranensis]MBE5032498.1 hypothetical protein [Gallalistipes aquisgranensis]